MATRTLLRAARFGIGLVLFLELVERVAWLIEPTVFGHLIDEVIARPHHPERLVLGLPFAFWIAVFVVNSGAGALRRVRAARVYPRLLGDIAVDVAETAARRGEDPSRAAARSELARDYVDFFQYRLPDFVTDAFNTVGTLVALAFYDWRISAACLAVAGPVVAIQRFTSGRLAKLQAEIHDRRERVFDAFAPGEADGVRKHYGGIAEAEAKVARYGGINFGLLRLLLLVVFVFVLYVAVDLDQDSTGDIYSIVTYLWTFTTSIEEFPEVLQGVGGFRDIARRLPQDSEPPPAGGGGAGPDDEDEDEEA